jgi:hypothetical protein
MDTLTIRQKLYEYIKDADDEKVEAMYHTILNDDTNEHFEWWNDGELVAELERRSTALKSGEDKGFTLEESRAHLMSLLKKDGR